MVVVVGGGSMRRSRVWGGQGSGQVLGVRSQGSGVGIGVRRTGRCLHHLRYFADLHCIMNHKEVTRRRLLQKEMEKSCAYLAKK